MIPKIIDEIKNPKPKKTKKNTTKKIAKHGKQAIIVVQKLLEEQLTPGTIVELKIEILKDNKI